MTNDPRSALNRLIAAFEAHLDAAATGDELSPAVVAAENALQDAFFTYDDSLFTAYGIELPFEAFDSDGDDEDDDGDDEDYDDGEYDEDDDDYDDSDDDDEDEDYDAAALVRSVCGGTWSHPPSRGGGAPASGGAPTALS